jgi:hypothetical protein
VRRTIPLILQYYLGLVAKDRSACRCNHLLIGYVSFLLVFTSLTLNNDESAPLKCILIHQGHNDNNIASVAVVFSVKLEVRCEHLHCSLGNHIGSCTQESTEIHLSSVLINVSFKSEVQTWCYYLKLSYWTWAFLQSVSLQLFTPTSKCLSTTGRTGMYLTSNQHFRLEI